MVNQVFARVPVMGQAARGSVGRKGCAHKHRSWHQGKSADPCIPSALKRMSTFSPYLVMKIKKKSSAAPDSILRVQIGYQPQLCKAGPQSRASPASGHTASVIPDDRIV